MAGYDILRIEEALVYYQSSKVFQNTFSLLASKKLRHTKLPKNVVTDEEIDSYCTKLNSEMGFSTHSTRITRDNLSCNDELKFLYKLIQNSILG